MFYRFDRERPNWQNKNAANGESLLECSRELKFMSSHGNHDIWVDFQP